MCSQSSSSEQSSCVFSLIAFAPLFLEYSTQQALVSIFQTLYTEIGERFEDPGLTQTVFDTGQSESTFITEHWCLWIIDFHTQDLYQTGHKLVFDLKIIFPIQVKISFNMSDYNGVITGFKLRLFILRTFDFISDNISKKKTIKIYLVLSGLLKIYLVVPGLLKIWYFFFCLFRRFLSVRKAVSIASIPILELSWISFSP